MSFDLVIFDCDGVLIDSERLAVRTESEVLTELGWPLSEQDVIDRFVGRSWAYMQGEIEAHLGRPVERTEFALRQHEVFERELTTIDGIEAVLDSLAQPYCVASSSNHELLAFTLGLTGLWPRFAGRIFSVEDVPSGKPAPDVFLHAAAAMGVAPERCAVVEDSVAGVEAGTAAGMTVFAFGGGVTSAARLARDGVVVFHSMEELPALLADASGQRHL